MLAAEVQADLLILMSDVDGIYTAPPSQDGAKMLSTFTSGMQNEIQFGMKSRVGTGGMDSKVGVSTIGIIIAMNPSIELIFVKGQVSFMGFGSRSMCGDLQWYARKSYQANFKRTQTWYFLYGKHNCSKCSG